MLKRGLISAVVVSFLAVPWLRSPSPVSRAQNIPPQIMDGLVRDVRVVEDRDGIPHIFAQNDHDALFMLGFLHGRDRLFQMDVQRRLFSGTLAELTGEASLQSDIMFRTLGLRRAAVRTWESMPPQNKALVRAYTEGVNAFLAQQATLPLEYGALERSEAAAWDVIDTLTVGKGLAFGLSFDSGDVERSAALEAFQAAGETGGFDGTALFSQDLFRTAPFDPAVTVPDDTSGSSRKAGPPVWEKGLRNARSTLRPQTLSLARGFLRRLEEAGLSEAFSQSRRESGSNWWILSGEHSQSGYPLFANDPHLGLNTPSTFYEAHLHVLNDPAYGPMNVAGVTFPGTPSMVQGCNERICWGSTVNPLDVTDYYQEDLVLGPASGPDSGCSLFGLTVTATRHGEEQTPVEIIPQTFLVNQPQSGSDDELEEAQVGIFEGGCTLISTRRNDGPILAEINIVTQQASGLAIQYAGWGATRELEAFHRISRARNVKDFREALQFFDFGSQNFGYADVEGNIAYFASGELPLREDLQAGLVDGLPPWFIRDGTGSNLNGWVQASGAPTTQSLAAEILPFDEMPQVVNPPSGFIISANNDPVGNTLDNDPLNEVRPGGELFYLNVGYVSLRAGRIERLIAEAVAGDEKLTIDDMISFQANNQLLDAEILTPFILSAFDAASGQGAPQQLADLASDARIAEAVGRLRNWDFSSPTGIQEGYDPGDDPDDLPQPDADEIARSVAATIYSVWRGQAVAEIIDATLDRIGAGEQLPRPDSQRSLSALRHLLDGFDQNEGRGASGVDFFVVEGLEDPAQERDFLLLDSLRAALDLLAGPSFQNAFGGSTDQDDYRWGRLHRIVFDHPLDSVAPQLSIPTASGFSDLDPNLRGLARSGGLGAVDASAHGARADSENEFMFGSGPARRLVAEMRPEGPMAFQVIPGGQSGSLFSPNHASQLGRWLTNQYHPLRLTDAQVADGALLEQTFAPAQFRSTFPLYTGSETRFTAFAMANLLEIGASAELINWRPDGSMADFPSNPATVGLGANRQTARLGSEFFEVIDNAFQDGWVEMSVRPNTPSAPGAPFIGSFFQTGNGQGTLLDGGTSIAGLSQRMVFTRVHEGTGVLQGQDFATIVYISNPGAEPIQLEVSLRQQAQGAAARGTSEAQTITREIPARGQFAFNPTLEFGLESIERGYLEARVVEGEGAVGFQLVAAGDGESIAGLNAAAGNGNDRLFAAQLAFFPDIIFSDISLINTSEFERNVTLEARPRDGEPAPTPVDIVLAPGELFQADAAEVFSDAESFSGSLAVRADGIGVVGDVFLGRPGDVRFAAALPMQTQPFTAAVFGQVANIGDFFTGLALFNPNDSATEVTIEVFTLLGDLNGSATVQLAAGSGISQTLAELVPASEEQTGGFIVLRSQNPIVGQEIFGTFDQRLQSAVPPTATGF